MWYTSQCINKLYINFYWFIIYQCKWELKNDWISRSLHRLRWSQHGREYNVIGMFFFLFQNWNGKVSEPKLLSWEIDSSVKIRCIASLVSGTNFTTFHFEAPCLTMLQQAQELGLLDSASGSQVYGCAASTICPHPKEVHWERQCWGSSPNDHSKIWTSIIIWGTQFCKWFKPASQDLWTSDQSSIVIIRMNWECGSLPWFLIHLTEMPTIDSGTL